MSKNVEINRALRQIVLALTNDESPIVSSIDHLAQITEDGVSGEVGELTKVFLDNLPGIRKSLEAIAGHLDKDSYKRKKTTRVDRAIAKPRPEERWRRRVRVGDRKERGRVSFNKDGRRQYRRYGRRSD